MTEGTTDNRIATLDLEIHGVVAWTPEIEHERKVAIFDLLEQNTFELTGPEPPAGPYDIKLSLRDATLTFQIEGPVAGPPRNIHLPMRPFRRLIKDYYTVCESYFEAIKSSAPSRIEAIDMGRRGLHDEGAEKLRETLSDRVIIDKTTARRLFTLVCVLHLRG